MSIYSRKQILAEIIRLNKQIDSCITEIVASRLAHDKEREGRAIFTMEGIIVGVQQDLSVLFGFLSEQEWRKDEEEELAHCKEK